MNKALHTDNAPAAIGPYSQAVQAEKTIYVSGQLPVDPATGEFAGEDIKADKTEPYKHQEHPCICRSRYE